MDYLLLIEFENGNVKTEQFLAYATARMRRSVLLSSKRLKVKAVWIYRADEMWEEKGAALTAGERNA